jgi:hypothetical protein
MKMQEAQVSGLIGEYSRKSRTMLGAKRKTEIKAVPTQKREKL